MNIATETAATPGTLPDSCARDSTGNPSFRAPPREWCRFDRSAVIAISCAFAFYAVLRWSGMGVTADRLSVAQFAALPFVLFAFLRTAVLGARIPARLLIASALTAALAAVGAIHPLLFGRTTPAAISRLQNDEFGAKSRILRDAVAVELGQKPLHHEGTLAGPAEAQALLDGGAAAVVGGSPRWLWVRVNGESVVPIGSLAAADLPSIYSELLFVRQTQGFGMPYEPLADTGRFLGLLFHGLDARSRSYVEAELDLEAAAVTRAPWRGVEHRGYAFWLVANLQVEAALSVPGGIDSALLKCAERNYLGALSHTESARNPELRAAVYNNASVARYLSVLAESTPADRKFRLKQARLGFKKAAKFWTMPTSFGEPRHAVAAARFNMVMTHELRPAHSRELRKQEKRAAKARRQGRAPRATGEFGKRRPHAKS